MQKVRVDKHVQKVLMYIKSESFFDQMKKDELMIEKALKGKGSEEETSSLNKTVTAVIEAYQDQSKFVEEIVGKVPGELSEINSEYKQKIVETLSKFPLKIGTDGEFALDQAEDKLAKRLMKLPAKK